MKSKTEGFYLGSSDTTYLTCKGAVEVLRSESNEFVLSGNGFMYPDTTSIHWYESSFNATGLTVDRIQL